MANQKITELTDLGETPAAGDWFVVVDISVGGGPETKKVSFADLGAAAQTPWLQNIDGGGFDLSSVGAIAATTFNGVALNAAGAATSYLDESGGYSVPAGAGDLQAVTDVGATTDNNMLIEEGAQLQIQSVGAAEQVGMYWVNNDFFITPTQVGNTLALAVFDEVFLQDIRSVGTMFLFERAAAKANLTGYGQLWVDSADELLKYTTESGVEFDLTALGGGGGSPFASPLEILGDINTATPPTTEAVTATLDWLDLAGDDLLFRAGFTGSNTFTFRNFMHGGQIRFEAENSGGSNGSFMILRAGSSSTFSAASNLLLTTGGEDALIATLNAQVALYHNDVLAMATRTQALGGLGAYNGYSGNGGSLQRVLTDTDFSYTDIRMEFSTLTTATDPGSRHLKTNNASIVAATEMYVNDLDTQSDNNEWFFRALQEGDTIIMTDEQDKTALHVLEVTGPPVDNTGWWTVPINRIAGQASNYTNNAQLRLHGSFGIAAGGGGSPAGSDTEMQFNNSGAFGASANLTWDASQLLVGSNATTQLTLKDTGNTASLAQAGIGFTDSADAVIGSINTFVQSILYNSVNAGHIFQGTAVVMQDVDLVGPVLQDYGIKSASEVVSANAFTITYDEGPAFEVDLEAATAAVTGTISGGAVSGDYGQITVKVEQDSSVPQTLTWAGGTFRWNGGSAHPVNTSAGGFTLYTFETWDGGSIWYAAGADYS